MFCEKDVDLPKNAAKQPVSAFRQPLTHWKVVEIGYSYKFVAYLNSQL